MPCNIHNVTLGNCVSCFCNDLIALTGAIRADAKAVPAKSGAAALAKRCAAFKDLSADDRDLIRSLTRAVNAEILKHESAEWIDPLKERDSSCAGGPVTAGERVAYRARLSLLGTWIGFTEFTVITEIFDVKFQIMMSVSSADWTPVSVGEGALNLGVRNDDDVLALAFAGGHYEVGRFRLKRNGNFERVHAVITNALGDCGPESFLIMYRMSTFRGTQRAGFDNRPGVVDFATARDAHAAGDGVAMDATRAEYISAITDLREQIAGLMSERQLDDAIVAEGRIDYASSGASPTVVAAASKVTHLAAATAVLPARLQALNVACRVASALVKNPNGTSNLQPVLHSSRNYYLLGANFSNPVALLNASAVLLQNELPMPKSEDADQLWSYPLDTKQLGFLGEAAKALQGTTRTGKYPTHVMTCAFKITASGQTHVFLCGAANMHDGPDFYLSEGNGGTHSEKICFLLAANVFRAFGMNLVFPAGNSERIVPTAGRWMPGEDDAPVKITDVEFVFLNIANFCVGACRKTWPQFRGALLAALPKGATARGTLYYALPGAENWFKYFR